MMVTVDPNAMAPQADLATKEYVQKEHKETTRLIVGLAIGMVGTVALTATLLTVGFSFTVSSKFDDLKASNELIRKDIGVSFQKIDTNIQTIHTEIKDISKDMNNLARGQAKIEGYITAKAPIK